jgi:hypothetical protein
MCFSPEVDVVSGVLIGVVGIDALRHVRRPAQLPLAALPILLAVHQLIESVVWWGLDGTVPASLGQHAEWLYLTIAFGVLPVLVPFAVGALEPLSRRRLVGVYVGVGVVVAADLMYAVLRGPITARIEGYHVEYRVELSYGGWVVVLYVLATCGALLMSTHRYVRVYGAVNLFVVLLLAWLDQAALISLWCAWAAVTSVVIAAHLRRLDTGRAMRGSKVQSARDLHP